MANKKHFQNLSLGAKAWNEWRAKHSRGALRINPDLSAATLNRKNLRGYNLSRANLWHTQLRNCDLRRADLSYAQMSEADLSGSNLAQCQIKYAILSRAQLVGTILRNADLRGTSLRRASLRNADLTKSNLRHVSLAEADLEGAKLSGSEVYGAGIWGIKGEPAAQSGLVIQPTFESPPITVDDLYQLGWLEDPRFSPDGRQVAFVRVSVDRAGNSYRHAIWLAPTDGGTARRFTAGAKSDTTPCCRRGKPRTGTTSSPHRTSVSRKQSRSWSP